MLLCNAFSLNMLASLDAHIDVQALSAIEAKEILSEGFESAVGHIDTAAVFSDELGIKIKSNRISINLEKGDVIVVGQYKGPRLDEGATTLPQGATIEWCQVTID